MNTQEYLTALRSKLGVTTDYGIAKALGVSKQAASRWSKGLSGFDDETAQRVAALLGMHPGLVVLDMHRERAKTPGEQSVWSEIYKGFLSLLLHAKSSKGFSPTW
jgi:transcriptional regulator with XRE-family HTH domain